jgi:hypothetical protein
MAKYALSFLLLDNLTTPFVSAKRKIYNYHNKYLLLNIGYNFNNNQSFSIRLHLPTKTVLFLPTKIGTIIDTKVKLLYISINVGFPTNRNAG